MTLNELIERLEELRDYWDVPGDSPIKGAFQPGYPLISEIRAITTFTDEDSNNARIFIALGDANEYGELKMWEDEVIVEQDEEEED